jgi:predicted aldo/keto reductase-like oxidoreductase
MTDTRNVDRDKAIPMLVRAYEMGVNYFDTGKWYCEQDSEKTLGEALKHMDRSRIYVSTKYAQDKPTAADLREKLEKSLELLDLAYVDFYHLWGISWKGFQEKMAIKGGPIEAMVRARDQGLVRHLSFSFHSDPADIFKIVDTGIFETMLCQYNLLDRRNEAGIRYAASKGLGVAVMGPVGGGRLGGPSEAVKGMLGGRTTISTPELALRFVLANPDVAIALSGMTTMQHVLENAATVSRQEFLSPEEKTAVEQAAIENQKLMDLYCTGCKYCMPCPNDVNIPRVFEAMNYYKVWDFKDHARGMYREIGTTKWVTGKRADACVECGECEPKCPQKIPIISQLKESHATLSG